MTAARPTSASWSPAARAWTSTATREIRCRVDTICCAYIRSVSPSLTSTPSRFAVVYHFYSLAHKHRLRLVVPVEEAVAEVDSLTSLWPGANWLEREVWDMFGIRFRGHPDLKRILMYKEFMGHPLRKDYPVNKRQPLIGPVN